MYADDFYTDDILNRISYNRKILENLDELRTQRNEIIRELRQTGADAATIARAAGISQAMVRAINTGVKGEPAISDEDEFARLLKELKENTYALDKCDAARRARDENIMEALKAKVPRQIIADAAGVSLSLVYGTSRRVNRDRQKHLSQWERRDLQD